MQRTLKVESPGPDDVGLPVACAAALSRLAQLPLVSSGSSVADGGRLRGHAGIVGSTTSHSRGGHHLAPLLALLEHRHTVWRQP